MPLQMLTTRATPKATRQAARYTPAGGAERCGMCRHYAPSSSCARIEGPISAAGWCMLFSRQVTAPHHAGQATALGGPPGVTLDLSLMTPGTLDPRITFTRASTATYFDSSGAMQTAAINAPRWDYNPSTHALNGLLIEEARTNITLQSGDLTNAAWAKANATLSVGIPGPNGPATGSGLISSNAAIGVISQSLTSVAGTALTLSCLVKAGALSTVLMLMPAAWWNDAANRNATYDLIAGTFSGLAGATASAAITAVGNGWYRIVLTATPDKAAVGSVQFIRAAANGDGVTVQTYAWGAQIEAGAFATSYIPTTAASVTRAAEQATMPTAAWYSAAAGTLVSDMIPQLNGNSNQDWPTLSAGDGQNLYNIRTSGPLGQVATFVANANVGTATPANGLTFGIRSSMAVSYVASTKVVTICLNAGTPATVTASSLPVVNLIFIGLSRTINPNCWHRRIRYWPRALTNAELQSVTA